MTKSTTFKVSLVALSVMASVSAQADNSWKWGDLLNFSSGSDNKNAVAVPQGNVSGSAFSDVVHYSIGGGAAIAPPPSYHSPNSLSVGLGWKADMMCGNFDLKTSLKSSLNGAVDGFKNMWDNLLDSAKGAIASMPALILQRANPQLYDILSNGLYQAKLDYDSLQTSCEELGAQMADRFVDSQWAKNIGLGRAQKSVEAAGGDIHKAKEAMKNAGQGDPEGKTWIGGKKKGGKGQEPIDILHDVVGAGYNMAFNRKVTDGSKITEYQCDGLICTEWKSPKEAADYAREVLGGSTLASCADCGTTTQTPGRGLAPQIQQTTAKKATQLQELLNSPQISNEQLNNISTSTVAVTRGLINALRTAKDAPILGARLAQELAISQELEKALALRRLILNGMKEPNVAQDTLVIDKLEKDLRQLDREIEQVKMEMELGKSINNNTALAILNNQYVEDGNTAEAGGLREGRELPDVNKKSGEGNEGDIDDFPTDLKRYESPILIPKSDTSSLDALSANFNASPSGSAGASGSTSSITPSETTVNNNFDPNFTGNLPAVTLSGTQNRQQFVNQMLNLAQEVEKKYGVPYEVLLAQGVIESNGGLSGAARMDNNLFGVKCTKNAPRCVTRMTQECGSAAGLPKNQCRTMPQRFSAYDNVTQAVEDYARNLKNNKAYASAWQYADNPEKFAAAIASTYATDPSYATMIIKQIRANKSRITKATTS